MINNNKLIKLKAFFRKINILNINTEENHPKWHQIDILTILGIRKYMVFIQNGHFTHKYSSGSRGGPRGLGPPLPL